MLHGCTVSESGNPKPWDGRRPVLKASDVMLSALETEDVSSCAVKISRFGVPHHNLVQVEQGASRNQSMKHAPSRFRQKMPEEARE